MMLIPQSHGISTTITLYFHDKNVGINKIGGRAWITLVNESDRTYNVRYVLESKHDTNVPAQYVVAPKIEVYIPPSCNPV